MNLEETNVTVLKLDLKRKSTGLSCSCPNSWKVGTPLNHLPDTIQHAVQHSSELYQHATATKLRMCKYKMAGKSRLDSYHGVLH
jgi:hypothetical protein